MKKLNSLEMLSAVWKKTAYLFKKYPAITGPFIIIAFFDLSILTILFLAPRPPLSFIFAPIIRTFWGERFLHYPVNFLLLPHLFNYARNIDSFIIGVTFSGVAVSLIHNAYENQNADWWFAIKKAVTRYLRLAIVWGLTFGSVILSIKVIDHFKPYLNSIKLMFGAEFLAGVFVQMIFIFAIPAIIIENKKIGSSIVRSLALVKNYPLAAFFMVFVPNLLFIPVTYLFLKLPVLIERFDPEATLYALILRIVTLTFIDFCITAPAVVLLLKHREYQNAGQTK